MLCWITSMMGSLKYRLAEAYDLPKVAGGAIEQGIIASLDSSVALQVLQEAHGLHSLRAACEDKVTEEFDLVASIQILGSLLQVSWPEF